LSLRRLAAYAAASLGGLVLTIAVLVLVFGDAILNRHFKAKVERAFAGANPGSVLKIGELDYSVGANRLVARSVALSSSHTTLKAGPISLTGVSWARLLWGKAATADIFAKSRLNATNLDVEFPRSRYGIRCARLNASVPRSELIAEGTELRTLAGDKAFFAGRDFRTTRFHVVVPEFRASGLAYGEWLRGKSYRARSVHFSRPSFDALVNREKPRKPRLKSPLMVHEVLATIRRPLQVDSLSITDGRLKYSERFAVGEAPAVLTFGAVSFSVEGLANRGDATAAVRLQAKGDLMSAGTLKVLMSIPITSPHFSLHYSGSLDAMDLACLSEFLDVSEHTRIKSGRAQGVTFEVDVTGGHARGHVRGIYKDLVVAILDKKTGTEKGFDNRFASFLANLLKVRNSNAPNSSGSRKEGKVEYTRRAEDTFLQLVWFALRTGVLDIISH
jgi:hypothetical protein